MECTAEVRHNYLMVDGLMSQGYGMVSKQIMCEPALSLDAKCVYAYMKSFEGGSARCDASTIQAHLGMEPLRASMALSELNAYVESSRRSSFPVQL